MDLWTVLGDICAVLLRHFVSTTLANGGKKCISEPLYVELSMKAKNCGTLLHMQTRMCMCSTLEPACGPEGGGRHDIAGGRDRGVYGSEFIDCLVG